MLKHVFTISNPVLCCRCYYIFSACGRKTTIFPTIILIKQRTMKATLRNLVDVFYWLAEDAFISLISSLDSVSAMGAP